MPMKVLIAMQPVVVLAFGILAVLLAGMRREKSEENSRLVALFGLITLAFAAWSSIKISGPLRINQLLVFDMYSKFFLLFSVLATAVSLIFSEHSREISKRRFPEYTAMLLTVCIGLWLMSAAKDLLMVYLAIETVSLSSYILTGFKRAHRVSHEASLKYVIFGGVASGVMIFGMSMLYGIAGTTSFDGIAGIFAPSGVILAAGRIGMFTMIISFVFIFTGLFFKIAAVPFHMWCPDVYQGAPTPFTGFLSVAPKAAGFALIMRFISDMIKTGSDEVKIPILFLIGLISAVTMTLGNLTAIHQTNIKRLLAYSSIAHAGYMLMGVVVLDAAGSAAVLAYLVVYLFMNLGAFAVVQTVADHAGGEDLIAYRGLGYRAATLAVFMAIFLFSLAGIPPLAGFIGKFFIFAAILQNGGFWFVILAVIGILNSAVGLFYYARILREMFLTPAETDAPIHVGAAQMIMLFLMVVPTVVLGIYWTPLQRIIQVAVKALELQ